MNAGGIDTGIDATPPSTLVLGAGVTGVSCVRHLLARGRRCRVADDRAAPPRLPELRALLRDDSIRLGTFDERLLDDVDEVIVSPGLAPDLPLLAQARARGVAVRGELDLFVDEARAPVVAITGTNGKSTVTQLAAAMLEACGLRVRAGGNLGPPAVDLLQEPQPAVYVLEISSFQLEHTPRLPARAAVVLNVAPDHLDRHASVEEYAAVKARIYRQAEVCVVNRDDPRVAAMIADRARCIGFTLGAPTAGDYGIGVRDGEAWLCRGDEPLLRASQLALAGRHNLANALAALALVEAFGVRDARALEALRSFRALAHRCQPVDARDTRRWINDSKGTNLAATLAAVDGLDGPLVLIAGGIAKERDFSPLAQALRGKVRAVVLIGRDAHLLAAALHGVAPLEHAADMHAAVQAARALSEPGDTVLLSPACASFDQFRDYCERGDAFAAAVRELAA